MASDLMCTVFEDFNDRREEPPPPAIEDPRYSPAAIEEIRGSAWTEGFLTGRQQAAPPDISLPTAANLLTSLHELGAAASEVVDRAAITVADMLVSTVIAATSESWSTQLLDRVRAVAEQIKPALTVAPEFILRDEQGTEHRFDDISDLSRVLETGGEDVTIKWHRGEALISRTAFLADLRNAIIPSVTAGAHPNIRTST